MRGEHSTKSLLASLAAGLILLLVLPQLFDSYLLTMLAIYALLALSLGLVWGFGGILCFGQAAFFGLGAYAYVVAAINIGESTLPVLIGIAVPAIVGFLLGLMMFYGRLGDVYLGVITLVVTLIFNKLLNSAAGPEYAIGAARLGGYNGIPGFPTLNVPGMPDVPIWGEPLYYVAAVVLLIVYAALRLLVASPFGRIAVGIRENELRAELMGYDPRIRKAILFSIGSAVAGLAGVLYANWSEVVTPGLFTLGLSAEVIIWCIVGGVGTLFGPMLGAVLLSAFKLLLGQQALVNNTAVMGGLLILVVLLLPSGILPQLQRLLPNRKSRAPRRARRSAGYPKETRNG